MKRHLYTLPFIFFIFFTQKNSTAQTQSLTDSSAQKLPQPKIQFRGLFQGRYVIGLHDNVDVNGLHHVSGDFVNNSFDLKRVRFATTAIISDRTEVNILLNLADFKSDPKNKVLENAYISYKINNYLSLIGGQFRPAFGLENTYPIDIIKSIDFSNQYYEFGNNGWESFQVGAGLTGKYEEGNLPVSYALTVFNGNGRNQPSDKDNGKQVTARVVLGLSKKNKINLGLNGGTGKVFKRSVYATGIDLTGDFHLGGKMSIEMQVEGKQGNNHNLYFNTDSAARPANINDFQMRGWYVLPNLRYAINYHRLSSIELSCRYEEFDPNFKNASNKRRTFIPMISFEFLKNYNARIQVAFQMDRYEHNIPNTSTYRNNLCIIQLQSRL
ncbi:porin [Olivibacter sp. CPCC 100613]|uniref:porin n=1 Tax=Olivibacter sp. CPCC 100613 TaxID=3079931 RepID=UPI002FF8872E